MNKPIQQPNLALGVSIFFILFTCHRVARADPPTTQGLAVPAEQQTPEWSDHMTGNWFGARQKLADHGITIEPNLIVDYSKNFTGGLDTEGNSFRERFNVPVTIDTEKLFGLHGGTIVAVYQLQHGDNASHTLTGDAQNFAFGTNPGDGRSQLGQLWYEQRFLDEFRLRLGKMDANADFDVMDNGAEFLNNSFSTSPTLGLMPSFPDTATGIQLFWEPKSGFFIGAGLYDGSQARGVHTGEYGPSHFLDSADDLFLIAEAGKHYTLNVGDRHFLGKLGVGAWWDTNDFDRLTGDGRQSGTGGVYVIMDQLLWKPYRQKAVQAGQPGVNPPAPEEEEYPGGIASCFSVSWCDPTVNLIDVNLLGGLTWTGVIPSRRTDVLGSGATYAHFSADADTRDDYELALETFYRIRFTPWVSLKPDLQYIIHPSGSGAETGQAIGSALVFTLRLEMSF